MRARRASAAKWRSFVAPITSLVTSTSSMPADFQSVVMPASIDLRAGQLDDLRPLRRLAARELEKLLRRARVGVRTQCLEGLAHRRVRERGPDLGIQPGHDLPGQVGRT